MHRFSGQGRKKRNGDDIPDSIHSSVPWIGSEISGGESIYKLVLLQELAGNSTVFCISKVYSVGVAGDCTWTEGQLVNSNSKALLDVVEVSVHERDAVRSSGHGADPRTSRNTWVQFSKS